MRTAVVIDDNLLVEARRLTGLNETTELMCEALQALIERESAWRSSAAASRDCGRFPGGRASPRDPDRHIDLGGAGHSPVA